MIKETIINDKPFSEALSDLRSDFGIKKITCKELPKSLIEKPSKLSPVQIKKLREKQLKVSQNIMAQLLNVSLSTYTNWESGTVVPKGSALKLLHLFKSKELI